MHVCGSLPTISSSASHKMSGVRHCSGVPTFALCQLIVAWLSIGVAGQRALAAMFCSRYSAAMPIAMRVIPIFVVM